MKPTQGIPAMWVHVMDIPFMEERTGHRPGSYRDDPDAVYLAFQRVAGAVAIDQYIPENPLTMSSGGFESSAVRGATTGIRKIVCDGIVIDSPEAVVEHLERFTFPGLERRIASFDADVDAEADALVAQECAAQRRFGPDILKIPYGPTFGDFPKLRYDFYGYENYLTAYLIYPEVMEQDFSLLEGGLPKLLRSDHDMADSRGTLVDVRSLDTLWFPHFARSIRPLLDARIRVIWHCDGNLMEMVPRLIEAGIGGFQGFQYEDGMDYERICRMTDPGGGPLLIWAGVSVTRTLPFGTPRDVRRELAWLVERGPAQGLFLGASSSVTPGANWCNIEALIEGLQYYRTNGRP